MAVLRNNYYVWGSEGVAATTGAGGVSKAAAIGTQVNVALFIKVDAATTISLECSPGALSAGINSNPADDTFYPLWNRTNAALVTFVFSGAGSACIDMSPFAPQYLRLKSTNNVNAIASVDIVG